MINAQNTRAGLLSRQPWFYAKRLLMPKTLAKLVCKVPFVINRQVAQLIMNQVFSEQIAQGDFDFLQNQLLQVEVRDAELFIGLSYQQGKLVCSYIQHFGQEADVSMSVESHDAIDLILQKVDPDTLFFQRKLKINGNTELAHQIKNTIDTLESDKIPQALIKMLIEYQNRVLIK